MSRRVNGKVSRGESYQSQLREAIVRYLPARGLPTTTDDDRVRWVPRLLVTCAVLMAWEAGHALVDRFAAARACVIAMFPTRRRPGATYAGFVAPLLRDAQCRADVRVMVADAGYDSEENH